MAKLSFYHDTRSGSGELPLKIRILHKKQNAYIGTGIRIAPEHWDAENGIVIGHTKAKTYNSIIRSKWGRAETVVNNLDISGAIAKYTAAQLKDIIENGGQIPDDKEPVGSSRRITNKKAVNEAKKAAEESQKAEKDIVEKSTQTISNTWDFNYNLQDE